MTEKLSRKISEALRRDDFERISAYMADSCGQLSADYRRWGKRMPNHENKIRNILLEEYLDDDSRRSDCGMQDYRFIPETQEHYDGQGNYIGRADIRIMLKTDFEKRDAYYLAECKRLDGSHSLNKEYVEEGVARFISRKYSAYYGKGMMLGFVVKHIDISKNAREIESLQNTSNEAGMHGKLAAMDMRSSREIYRCVYRLGGGELELRHVFADFSGLVDG